MCGIVGYLGDEGAAPHILAGLRALEYRGYDSAGLAVMDAQSVNVRRCTGRIDELAELVAAAPVEGSLGIGHTRWATHGAVTDANAHPHSDASGRVFIVHNGITDNFAELKAELRSEGHEFTSQTDTEVVAHVIGRERDGGLDLPMAVAAAMRRLDGAHAVLALCADEPDLLVAARSGAAGGLCVGRNSRCVFLASDLPAVVRHTREVQVLEANELAVVQREEVGIRNLAGQLIERPTLSVPWDPMSAAKAGYRHFFSKEIHEQPEALASTIRPRVTLDPAELKFDQFKLPLPAREIEHVTLLGSGTAGYAGMIGRHYMERIARVPADTDIASEFAYRSAPLSPRTLVIAITQSGETADALLAIERAKAEGATVAAVVNTVGSEATRRADAVLYTHAGPEVSVAATKTFSTQLAALYLLACRIGYDRGAFDSGRFAELIADIAHVPLQMRRALRCEPQVESLARRYHRYRNFLFIGRGLAQPLALEGALKLKEISYIHAEGYAAGELKHGPISLIEPEVPAVAIVFPGPVREKTLNAVEQVRARDGRVLVIACEGDDRSAELATDLIQIPKSSELIAPILATVPLQLFAYHVAVWLGCDVDQPRNLAKSVTVE